MNRCTTVVKSSLFGRSVSFAALGAIFALQIIAVAAPTQPPVEPPVTPPVKPPVEPSVKPPVTPPVKPPVIPAPTPAPSAAVATPTPSAPTAIMLKYGDSIHQEIKDKGNLRFKFSGKKGDILILDCDRNTYYSLRLVLYQPDGKNWLILPDTKQVVAGLPTDGTYTVIVTSEYGGGTVNITLNKAAPLKLDQETGDLMTFTDSIQPQKIYVIKPGGPLTLYYRRISGELSLSVSLLRQDVATNKMDEVATLSGRFLDAGTLATDAGSDDIYIVKVAGNAPEYSTLTGRGRFSIKVTSRTDTNPKTGPDTISKAGTGGNIELGDK